MKHDANNILSGNNFMLTSYGLEHKENVIKGDQSFEELRYKVLLSHYNKQLEKYKEYETQLTHTSQVKFEMLKNNPSTFQGNLNLGESNLNTINLQPPIQNQMLPNQNFVNTINVPSNFKYQFF